MIKKNIMENEATRFDLEERTSIFGEEVIKLCKKIPFGIITNPLISQLVRSATSVGANYCEADDAVSKNDFRYKIGIVKKETRESKYFLRMIATAAPKFREDSNILLNEAKELNLIFNAIFQKLK